MKLSDRFSVESKKGVFQFLEVAQYYTNNYGEVVSMQEMWIQIGTHYLLYKLGVSCRAHELPHM